MRLVTYDAGAEPRPGALRGSDVVDLSGLVESILALVAADAETLAAARELTASGASVGPVDDVRLLAPIPEPRNHLYCVGWNYPKHYGEGIGKRAGQETDERSLPTFFTKPPASVIGPSEAIAWDRTITEKLDYEGELALVLGRTGRSIAREDAMSYVFGYTLANDVTARDVQRRHGGQWLKGKGMDTYCPLGPVLVTSDEIDPTKLRLRLSVNGETRQDDLTGNMIFPLDLIVAELSLGMTLYAGDIVLTGTPAGVGFSREPAVFLVPGDVVEVAVDEIGTLRNPVEERALAPVELAAAAVTG